MIPQVTVQELKPPRPLQAILQDYSKRGRSGRGGFWVAKPCVICGTFFDIRQHPNKPENLRKTCGPLCSIENRHRKSKEWRLANPLTPAQKKRKAEQDKIRRANNPEKERQYVLDRKAREGPEKRKAYHAAYYQDHKEKYAVQAAIRYQENKENLKAQNRARYAENRDFICALRMVIRQDNMEELNSKRRTAKKAKVLRGAAGP